MPPPESSPPSNPFDGIVREAMSVEAMRRELQQANEIIKYLLLKYCDGSAFVNLDHVNRLDDVTLKVWETPSGHRRIAVEHGEVTDGIDIDKIKQAVDPDAIQVVRKPTRSLTPEKPKPKVNQKRVRKRSKVAEELWPDVPTTPSPADAESGSDLKTTVQEATGSFSDLKTAAGSIQAGLKKIAEEAAKNVQQAAKQMTPMTPLAPTPTPPLVEQCNRNPKCTVPKSHKGPCKDARGRSFDQCHHPHCFRTGNHWQHEVSGRWLRGDCHLNLTCVLSKDHQGGCLDEHAVKEWKG